LRLVPFHPFNASPSRVTAILAAFAVGILGAERLRKRTGKMLARSRIERANARYRTLTKIIYYHNKSLITSSVAFQIRGFVLRVIFLD